MCGQESTVSRAVTLTVSPWERLTTPRRWLQRCCPDTGAAGLASSVRGAGGNLQHPGVLERGLAELGSLLLELLDDTLVDAAALVDQVSGGGRLSSVDVADKDK